MSIWFYVGLAASYLPLPILGFITWKRGVPPLGVGIILLCWFLVPASVYLVCFLFLAATQMFARVEVVAVLSVAAVWAAIGFAAYEKLKDFRPKLAKAS